MENILERVQRVDPKKIAWDKTVEEVESNPKSNKDTWTKQEETT